MIIENQIAVAIAAYLTAQTVTNDPTIISGMVTDLNDEATSRIVVIGTESTLRKASLPGLFDVSGTVNVIQSVDETGGDTKFHEMCDAMESILGARNATKAALMAIDTDLFIYSWQWLGEIPAANNRKFMASYNWTAFARNSPNTTT